MTDEETPLGDRRGPRRTPLFADDEFYRALAARPRRRVMSYLLDEEESSVDELATLLCGWETMNEAVVSSDERERIRVALYHSHLPLLADAGLVTYDPDEGRVSVADLDAPIEDLIRRGIESELTMSPDTGPLAVPRPRPSVEPPSTEDA